MTRKVQGGKVGRLLRSVRYELVHFTNPRRNKRVYHTLPLDDLKPHDETPTCWCGPKVEHMRCRNRRATLVVHNSADGRELPVM